MGLYRGWLMVGVVTALSVLAFPAFGLAVAQWVQLGFVLPPPVGFGWTQTQAGTLFGSATVVAAPTGCVTEEEVRSGDVCGGLCGGRDNLVMVFYVYEQHRDPQWGASRIQEAAVHETAHVFQRQKGATDYENGGGDASCGDDDDVHH